MNERNIPALVCGIQRDVHRKPPEKNISFKINENNGTILIVHHWKINVKDKRAHCSLHKLIIIYTKELQTLTYFVSMCKM